MRAATDASLAEWFPIDNLPKVGFDHEKIIYDGLERLHYDIQTTNIAVQLLPEKFTLAQLQTLYEKVLGKELDKRNFRKKIRELNVLTATKETHMEGAHRPALLYKFTNQHYMRVKEKMHVFVR